jgi:PIN domain nuclease of toxin-antitoxin system
MKSILLDAHTFIWYITGDKSLDTETRNKLQDTANTLYISVTSFWELLIKDMKSQKNPKSETALILPKPALTRLRKDAMKHAIQIVSLEPDYLEPYQNLPEIHGDPFDRILISIALEKDWYLAHSDGRIKDYSLKHLYKGAYHEGIVK